MSQPSKDVSLNIESGMDSENVGAVWRKHAQVTAIFQIAQKYALSLVRNVNSTVDVVDHRRSCTAGSGDINA